MFKGLHFLRRILSNLLIFNYLLKKGVYTCKHPLSVLKKVYAF
jgi:hypothetical protein